MPDDECKHPTMIIRHPFGAELAPSNLVADYLLVESRERGDLLTNLKLQKLIYYAQAWFLALFDKELFREDFRAWVHGPVLPSQYRRFREYEWRPIDHVVHRPGALPRKVGDHLNEIVDVFGVESATALEIMTHKEAPWKDARRGLAPTAPSSAIIPKEAIKTFYKHM